MRRTVCGWWCGTKQQTSKQAVARGVRRHSSVVRGLPRAAWGPWVVSRNFMSGGLWLDHVGDAGGVCGGEFPVWAGYPRQVRSIPNGEVLQQVHGEHVLG